MENGTVSNVSSVECHAWIREYVDVSRKDISIEDLNSVFLLRLIGGILFVILLASIGLVGNLHVIYIYGRKFKPSIYRIFVLWLGIIDIFNVSVSAPLLVDYLFRPLTYYSEPMCQIFRFLLYACAICSSCALVVIAIDRCLKILRPFRRPLSVRTAKILCGMCVVIAVLFSWPAILLFKITDVPTGIAGVTGMRCLVAPEDLRYFAIFSISHVAFFAVESTLLIIAYSLVGWKVWSQLHIYQQRRETTMRQSMEVFSVTPHSGDHQLSRHSDNGVSHPGDNRLSHNNNGQASQHNNNNNNNNNDHRVVPSMNIAKTTGTLFVVTLAYILSALPHHVLSLVFFIVPNFDCGLSLLQAQFYYTFIWSYMVNSAINPFIYGFRDTRFRREIKAFYKKFKLCEK